MTAASGDALAQPPGYNYDEAKVPAYTLPDPLRLADGEIVKEAQAWRQRRRPEVLRLFETHVYGRSPEAPVVRTEVSSVDPRALRGQATRKELTVRFGDRTDGPRLHLLLYLPNGAKAKAPAFLGLNFGGNHTVSSEPGIALPGGWMPEAEPGVVDHRATDAGRGRDASAWPVETIVKAGFALATAYYGDLEPDFPEGLAQGVRGAFGPGRDGGALARDDWGALAAWAWGLRGALDALAGETAIDAGRVALVGHSRLGKAALWAGAQDERFALVISNESGEGGAALSRRRFGETVAAINNRFPHWFCANYKTYNDREDDLPVDQHLLIALLAPRPVYVASAAEDLWADPRGEFLSAKNAEPVYRLFGRNGLGVAEPPPVDTPVGDAIRYHNRTGKHALTAYDWDQYLAFARRWLAAPAR